LFEKTIDYFKKNLLTSIVEINIFRFFVLTKLGYLPILDTCQICNNSKFNELIFSNQINAIFFCRACFNNLLSQNFEIPESKIIVIAKNEIDILNFCIKKFMANDLSVNSEIENISQKTLENFLQFYIMNIYNKLDTNYFTLKKIFLN